MQGIASNLAALVVQVTYACQSCILEFRHKPVYCTNGDADPDIIRSNLASERPPPWPRGRCPRLGFHLVWQVAAFHALLLASRDDASFMLYISTVAGETSAALSLIVTNPNPRSAPHSSYPTYQIYYARLATAALADALITLATYYYIHRATHAHPPTPAAPLPALSRCLTTMAETNALTFVLVVATAVVMAASKGFWANAVGEAIPGAYIVSLMVSLLSRSHVGEEGRASLAGEMSEGARVEVEQRRVRDAAWVEPVTEPGSAATTESTQALVRVIAEREPRSPRIAEIVPWPGPKVFSPSPVALQPVPPRTGTATVSQVARSPLAPL